MTKITAISGIRLFQEQISVLTASQVGHLSYIFIKMKVEIPKNI